MRVWVADINGDGKLDILAGDSVTLTSPAKGVKEDEVAAKLKDWSDEYKKASQPLQKLREDQQKLLTKQAEAKNQDNKEEEDAVQKELDGNDKKQRDIYSEVNKAYAKRGKIVTEEMTGYVWAYLQK